MENIKRTIHFIVDHIIVLILIFSGIAFFYPDKFAWMTQYTSIFLGAAMFGMGTTIHLEDLKNILKEPKVILVGICAQFICMPLIAWALCKVFHLPGEIALGVILVGCCPGGTASNVMTHIAGGDVVLSVSMTTVATLIAPILTPLLVFLFAGAWVEVSLVAMFITVIKVILIPVLLGMVINRVMGDGMKYVSPFLPLVSALAIILIIAGIIALNADKILESGLLVTGVVFLHNLIGLLMGLGISNLLRIDHKKATALAIEVGMQNSGLAVSLATANFAISPLATLPGAIFSVIHNVTGTVFARIRRGQESVSLEA